MLANVILLAALGQVAGPSQGPVVLLSAETEDAMRRAVTTPPMMERSPRLWGGNSACIICRLPSIPILNKPKTSILFVRSTPQVRIDALGVKSLGILARPRLPGRAEPGGPS